MEQYPRELILLAVEYKDRPTGNISKHKKDIFQLLCKHTSFLPDSSTTSVRLHHIRSNTFSIPVCKMCDNHVKWVNTKQPHGYAMFCSSKCAATSPETIAKRKQTCIDHFGVDSFSQTDGFRSASFHSDTAIIAAAKEQRATTNNRRYGTPFTTSLPDVIRKRQVTTLKKYGHTNVLASNYVQQIKLEKYGVVGYTSTPQFKLDRADTMISRYGVLYSGQNAESITKGKATNSAHYGYDAFSQSHIDKESLDKSNDVNWLHEQHHEIKKPLSQIALELGVSLKTIQNRFNLYNIGIVRYPKSWAEQQLLDFFKSLNIQVVSGDRTILNGKELDIYLPGHDVAIEYCGLYWHSDAHIKKDKHYHKQKLDACALRGIKLITIFEDEWIHTPNLVKATLLYKLGLSQTKSIPARKCKIRLVDTSTKTTFFNHNHIQGNGPSSINIGLFYDDVLVSCMGFIKQLNNVYNLNRFATSASVMGGFGKTLKYFITNFNPSQIISFADLRWSTGDVYTKSGFVLDKKLPPDYEYVDLHNIKRIHKFNFRHKNLPNILGDKYDPLLSETQNTKNNNWFKIWNCGLLRYTMDF